jgi:tripeptidyl-peptidase-1
MQGATQGLESNAAEIVCQSDLGGVITSGGGFSEYYPRPTWQTDSVEAYFNLSSGLDLESFSSGGRAYPDVSWSLYYHCC